MSKLNVLNMDTSLTKPDQCISVSMYYLSFEAEGVRRLHISRETVVLHSFRCVSCVVHLCFQKDVLMVEVSVKA